MRGPGFGEEMGCVRLGVYPCVCGSVTQNSAGRGPATARQLSALAILEALSLEACCYVRPSIRQPVKQADSIRRQPGSVRIRDLGPGYPDSRMTRRHICLAPFPICVACTFTLGHAHSTPTTNHLPRPARQLSGIGIGIWTGRRMDAPRSIEITPCWLAGWLAGASQARLDGLTAVMVWS
jgi:hypothetical protein